MMLELWERVRGYDNWVETRARIERSQVTGTPYANRSGQVVGHTYNAGDVIAWTDASGELQYASFEVEEASPLFQLIDGETVSIRYDPSHPERFYYRDLLRPQVRSGMRTALVLLCCVSAAGLFLWARLN